MDDVFYDQWGNYFDRNGDPLSVYDLIARGIDVAGAALSHSPYYSPDDPRYQQRGGYPYPQAYPVRTNQNDVNIGGSLDPRRGLTTNLQISPWMLAVGGLAVGAFLFGRRR